MKRVFTIGWVFLLLGLTMGSVLAATAPLARYRLNLTECVSVALRNNEEIKAATYDIEASVAKKIEATKRYVPVVKYQYRVAPVPQDIDNAVESLFIGDVSVFNSIKIEAGIPLSTFGRLPLAKSLADLGIDASKLKKRQKSDEVVLNVYKLYQGILLARDLKGLANQALDAINKKIIELEKEENTDQLEILKLKVVLYEIERRVDEADSKELIALSTLKVLMGMEDDVDFDIKDANLHMEGFQIQPFETFMSESRNHRPEFKLLELGVAAREKQIQLEKKEYLPKLLMGGLVEVGYAPNIIGDEDEDSFSNPFNYKRAGIGFEVSNELDFRKIKAKVKGAEASYLQTIAQKRAAFQGLRVDLKKAYLELIQQQKLVNRANKEMKAARQIVFLTKSNLDIGLGEKKDYLDALQSYLVFQGRKLEAIFNYNTAVATLKQKMGTLYSGQKN